MRSQQDFYSGLLFMAFGIAFAWGAGTYDMGSADQMGPGYFPRLLGILTALTGVAVALKGVVRTHEDRRIGPWAWKQLVLIICANLIFGVMIGGLPSINLPPMGLVLGVYCLVFIASFASQEFRLKEVVTLSTILVIAVYAICVKLLNLYVPLWPPIITG
jgi:hypothetical protein